MISDPYFGISGPKVAGLTSNTVVTVEESSAFVAALRIGLKSKLSRSSYFVPEFIDVYDGIVA